MRKVYSLLLIGLFALIPGKTFDTTPTSLPFSQNWSNTSLVNTTNDWSGVPGIIGYRGDDLTTATGTDPQTILADGSSTPVSVVVNQANPNTNATGAVAEFDGIADPAIALQGSGTADAPHIVISLNTTGFQNVNVAYNLRDIDGSTDNAVQAVALQYRIGNSGSFTNVSAGFVADATTGPGLATLVTAVSASLPSGCDNEAIVQLRIITANAAGNDEWVGVDDILITGTPMGGGASLSATPLNNFGNVCISTTTAPNSFTITGSNLTTANVTVAALPGFSYSTSSAGTYTSSLSLFQPGGAYSQQIFVQFSPAAVQSYDGNIVVGGGGASNINVAAFGSGVNIAPTVTTGAVTNITTSSADIPGTITANGCSPVTAYGAEFSTTNNFTPGTGTQVVGGPLAGNAFIAGLGGLTGATIYYYRTYATNSGGTSYSSQSSFTSVIPEPANHATAFACGTSTVTTISLTWTDATGGTIPTGYLIKWSSVSYAAIANPVDGTPESNGPGVLNVAAGVQAGMATGLTGSTPYFFKIFPYTNAGTNINYKTGGTIPQTSCATSQAPLVAWQFGNPQSTGDEVTYNATTSDVNLTTSVLSRGSGIAPAALQRGFSSNGFSTTATTLGDAVAANEYYQFAIQANGGYAVSLSALDARLRRTATAPNAYIWRYSLDGINFTDIGTSVSFTSTVDGVDQPVIDLSGISALQNVPVGTTITFRLYMWGGTSATATFAIGRFAATNTSGSLAVTGGLAGTILPVAFANVKATCQSNSIKVEWSNMTELDVVNYVIERSADGRNFLSLATVNATLNNGGKADYSFIDANPFAGINYYRIRSLESSGKSKYSVIVKVDIRSGATVLVLYPNPVTGGQLTYQANNLVKGQYTIRIVNGMGQQVYSKTLNHPGGSVSEGITLHALKAGIYSMQLGSNDNNFVKTFVVQ